MDDPANKLRDTLQKQMDAISIEMCHPIKQAVAQQSRVMISGQSDASKQMRFGKALFEVILERMSLLERLSVGSKLACFNISMGIKAAEWSKSCSIEYEPDCVFIEKKDAASMPYSVFGAIVMVELVWTNRPFLDTPAVIDPGLLFQKLESYVMVDFLGLRLVLFRRNNKWQPELFDNHRLPKNIDGLDFEIDWNRVYAEAGITIPRMGFLETMGRIVRRLVG